MQREELSHQPKTVCRVAAETADGLCNDKIDLTGLTVAGEAQELRSFILLRAGNAFVEIEPGKFPIVTRGDVILVMGLLRFEAFELCIGIRRDAAVGCYPDLFEGDLGAFVFCDFSYLFQVRTSFPHVYTSL